MKKNSLKKLAFIGIASGLCAIQTISAAEAAAKKSITTAEVDPNDGNLGYHLMTEQELFDELNDDGLKLYNSLTPDGKSVAREIASQRCNGTNECKGRNSCKTEKNGCAGKGACKGQSKCAVADKNLAVKLASNVMAEKRNETLKK